MTRALLPLLATLALAFGAAAQTAEFGHATGGTIETITKATRQMSRIVRADAFTGRRPSA
jgi:hypothetical protein